MVEKNIKKIESDINRQDINEAKHEWKVIIKRYIHICICM